MNKFNVGDRVIYDGLVGIVKSVCFNGAYYNYGLVAELEPEAETDAPEDECSLATQESEEELDQEERLRERKSEGREIARMVDSISDKYIGDCSF